MHKLTLAGWIAFALVVGWYAYAHRPSEPGQDDCQHYDSLGRGIGCEGADLADM